MRVLWLCNIILPELSAVFGFKRQNIGGWLTGAWNGLKKYEDIDLGICCMINNPDRMMDGISGGISYFSILNDLTSAGAFDAMVNNFAKVLQEFQPDVVHVWGTEFAHSYAMGLACERENILEKLIVGIQGLVSIISKHYSEGIPYIELCDGYKYRDNILNEMYSFKERGNYELKLLRLTKQVVGRTNWDKACVFKENPSASYYHVWESLRDEFYNNVGIWSTDTSIENRIFVSQASYPIKGLHFLLEALPEIIREYPNTKVVIGGGNPFNGKTQYGTYLKTLINNKNIEGHIECLDFLTAEQMIEQYKLANVFVSASVIENESNSVHEAMLVGCPVVSSYVGGVIDVITHGENGFLYQATAPYMLAYYVCKLFADKDLQSKFSKNSTQLIRDVVNPEKNRIALMNVYKGIAKARL